MSGLVLAAAALRDALSGFDARLLSGDDAASVFDELARTEKVCAAAKAKAAARVEDCRAHKDKGFSAATEWMAKASGESSGKARADLETAKALQGLSPETNEAVDQGELSLAQAQEIAKTEAECPGTEREMLALAKEQGLRALKERGRRLRQAAVRPEELEAKRRAARGFESWRNDLGNICFRGELTPEVGVPFLARIEAEVDRLWRAGERDATRRQRAADAFAAVVAGNGRRHAVRADVVFVWDLNADAAHIPGVGPVTLDTVRAFLDDAFVTAVLHDGKRVESIRRFGKHIPPELRLLVSLGGAPDFDGAVCSVCGRRFALQIDHVDPRANDGLTELANLDPKCPQCHRDKTDADRRAGLLDRRGRRGSRPLPVRPDGTGPRSSGARSRDARRPARC